jgi:asparagine synthetase B (glutamine-hydrolysing)
MNGYILAIGASLTQTDAEALADQPISTVRLERLTDQASILGWGSSPGDVHWCFRESGGSLLIVNGCIAGAPLLPEIEDPQQACDQLLRRLDAKHSVDDVSTLARRIFGSFSLVYWNRTEGQVFCVTDRIDSRSIWYRHSDDRLLISSHANAIARLSDSAGFDAGALGSFLLYGSMMEPTKCLHRGIRAVGEGAVAVATPGGQWATQRWYRFAHRPEAGRSLNEWADLVAQRLLGAARRILATVDNPMVFLSGGLDSRLTAAALRAAGGDPLLVTLGDTENLEIRMAKRAALALGSRHEIILRDPGWYLRGIDSAVFESDACHTWEHAHFCTVRADGGLVGVGIRQGTRYYHVAELQTFSPRSDVGLAAARAAQRGRGPARQRHRG